MVPRRTKKTWSVKPSYVLGKYSFDRDIREVMKRAKNSNELIYEAKTTAKDRDPKVKLEILYQKAIRAGALE